MSEETSKKTKLPRNASELLKAEDRLAELQAFLRYVRNRLEEGPISTVDWKFGTFLYKLKEIEDGVPGLRGEFETQYNKAVREASVQKVVVNPNVAKNFSGQNRGRNK